MRGIVLETAVLGRIVGWRNHDAIGQSCLSTAIVSEDRVRDNRGRRVLVICGDHHIDTVRRQYFHGAGESGLGDGVSVDTEEERSIDGISFAVLPNRLCYGE